MVEKKNKEIKKKMSKKENDKVSCADQFCPIHGLKPLKIRGRTFEGKVIKKLPGRITIIFERMISIPKYERYEKRKTKLHARLPDCLAKDINIGDTVKIGECRHLSKMIHFVVIKKIRRELK